MISNTDKFPDSPIIKEAITLVKAAVSENIFHHSMRTYYLGVEFAGIEKVNIEKEELLLSALFHDIGFFFSLSVERKTISNWKFSCIKRFLWNEKKHPPARINAMMEAIDYHFQLKPRWDKGEVAGILQIGAHMDVIKKNVHKIDKNRHREILRLHPKNFFFLEFNYCLFKNLSSVSSLIGLFFPEKYFGANHYIS